jgi:hypothetical protein
MLSEKLGFDIVLLDCMDLDMEFIFQENENPLPINLVNKFVEKYPEVPKYFVQKNVSDFIEIIRKRKECERTFHNDGKWLVDDSYGGPDSGYMGYYCKKCGFSDGTQLY